MNQADVSIADEFAVTVDSVFVLAAAALAAESPEEAGRLRSAARAQLAVCGVFSRHVRRMLAVRPADGEIVDLVGAAAAGSSDLAGVAPSSLSEEEQVAKYDSAGFSNPMPGTADVTHADSYTQGSTGAMGHADGERPGERVQVTDWSGSAQETYTAQVGPESTWAASDQSDVGSIGGSVVPGPAVPPGGHVVTPHHPGAGR